MNAVGVGIIGTSEIELYKRAVCFLIKGREEKGGERRGERKPDSSGALTTNYTFFYFFS